MDSEFKAIDQIPSVVLPPTAYLPPRTIPRSNCAEAVISGQVADVCCIYAPPPDEDYPPPPPPLDDHMDTSPSSVANTVSTDQRIPFSPFTNWNNVSPLPTPPHSRPISIDVPRSIDHMPLPNTPASPGRFWVEHSREKARRRRDGDELGWSRHSVESTSTGHRASRKYDEIELGVRRAPPPLPPSIYFGGCAFGASFYIGCIRALCDMYGPQFYKDCLICGDSGGSIFAVGLSLGFHPEGRGMMHDD